MILGFDIGGTKTAAVLGTTKGEIRWKKQVASEPERGFEAMFADIVTLGREAVRLSPERIDAVSVSIGGPLDVLNGIIQSPPNLPGWDEIPLKKLLNEKFAFPVYIEHDGNAGALAEYLFGAGRGCRNLVFLTMGTGFGAGLILDGKLYRGTTDMAGEIGHIRIAEDGPLCYGKRGSLEGYCSGTGIARLAASLYPSLWNDSSTALSVYDAFLNGSDEARQIFEKAGLSLGRAFAMIGDLLNPERIILGGIGMRIGDAFLPVARDVFQRESLPRVSEVCTIVPAQLGEKIGDVASLCGALDQGGLTQG